MRKLLLVVILALTTNFAHSQDSTDVRRIQLKLDRYEKQSNTGLRFFGVGCFIGAATVVGLERLDDSGKICRAFYGLAAGCAATGIIIHMDASRQLRTDPHVNLFPGTISLNF